MRTPKLSKLVALVLTFVLAFETALLNVRNSAWGSYERLSGVAAENIGRAAVFSSKENVATTTRERRRRAPLVLRPQASTPSRVQLVLSRNSATAEVAGEQGQIVLTATVQNDAGQPVSGIHVSWQVDKALVVSPESGYTDAAGSISATVTSIEALTSTVKLRVGGMFEFDTGQVITFERPAPQVVAGDLVIDRDTVLTTNLYVQGNLVIRPNVRVLLVGQRLIEAENIVVGSGAHVSADGTGHGAGRGASPGRPTHSSATGGGGHGGRGGEGGVYPPDTDPGLPGDTLYGDKFKPERMGSSGGVRNGDLDCPGKGGGAIKLIARRVLTHEGTISANGTSGAAHSLCGGGSGGSVWISATHLFGYGAVLARGGDGDRTYEEYIGLSLEAGGGGGGRIAVYGAYVSGSYYYLDADAGWYGRTRAESGTTFHAMPIDVNASQVELRRCFVGRRNYETFRVYLTGPDGFVVDRSLRVRVEPARGFVRRLEFDSVGGRFYWTGWDDLGGWWNVGGASIGETNEDGERVFQLALDHPGPVTVTIFTEDGVVITPAQVLTFTNTPISDIGWSVHPSPTLVGEQVTVTGWITGVGGEPASVQVPVRLELILPDSSILLSRTLSSSQGVFTMPLTSLSPGQYGLVAHVHEDCSWHLTESNLLLREARLTESDLREARFNGPRITIRSLREIAWLNAPVTATVGDLVTFTGRLLDTAGNPIANRAVRLSVTPGYADATPEFAETDAAGVFTVTLTATRSGIYVLRAAVIINGSEVLQTAERTIEFLGSIRGSLRARDPLVWVDEVATLEFALRTGTDDPLPGWSVEVRAEGEGVSVNNEPITGWRNIGTTQGDGTLSFTLRSNRPGPVVVDARAFNPEATIVYTLARSAVITFAARVEQVEQVEWHSSVPNRAEMPDSGLLTVTLRGAGGAPITERPAVIQCRIGDRDCAVAGLYVVSTPITSDANGQVVAALAFTPNFSSNVPFVAQFDLVVLPPAGSYAWTTQHFTNAFQLEIFPPKPSITHTYVVISPSVVPYKGGGSFDPPRVPELTYTLIVRDQWGRVLPGRQVTLSTTGSGGYFLQGGYHVSNLYTRTNAAGAVIAGLTYLGNFWSGSVHVRAEVADGHGGALILTRTAQVVAGPASHMSFAYAGRPAAIVNRDTIFITVTLYDSSDRALPGRVVTLVPEACCSAGLVVSTPITRTDHTGRIFFRLSATQPVTVANLLVVVQPSALGDVVTSVIPHVWRFIDPQEPTDPLRSTLVANPRTQFADGEAFILVTATLKSEEDVPIPSRPVLLKAEGQQIGAVDIQPTNGQTMTNGSGVISWRVNSIEPQTLTLRAVDAAFGITLSQEVTVSFSVGPLANTSLIEMSPTYLPANGRESVLISATLRDSRSRLLPNYLVYLLSREMPGTNGVPIITPTFTQRSDERGHVRFYVASSKPGGWHLYLGDGVDLDEFGLPKRQLFVGGVEFYGEAISRTSSIYVDKDRALAYGMETVNIVAHLKDAQGRAVPGTSYNFLASRQDVTLTQPFSRTTNAGEARAMLAAHQPGPVMIWLMLPGGRVVQSVPITFYVPVLWRPHSEVTLPSSAIVADGTQTALVQATLRNLVGAPVANRQIRLLVSDEVLFPGGQVRTTDPQGVVTFTLASTKAGRKHLQLEDVLSGESIPAGQVDFVPSAPDVAQSTLMLNKSVALVDDEAILLTLILRDAHRNLIPNHPVVIDAGGLVEVVGPTATDSQGVLMAQLKSSVPHTATVSVSVRGTDGVSRVLPALTATFVEPVSRSRSEFTVSPRVITADGQSAITVIAQLRDGQGNVLPGRRVRLSVTRSGSATEEPVQISPAREVQSDEQGRAIFAVRSTRSGEFSFNLIFVENTQVLTRTTVQFTSGPLSLSRSQLELRSSRRLPIESLATVAVMLRDEFGNPVHGRPVRTELSASAGELMFADVSVSAIGSGYVLTQTSDENGEVLVRFTSFVPQDVVVVARDALSDAQIGSQVQLGFNQSFSVSVEALSPGAQANGEDAIRVRLRVKDHEDKPVSGLVVRPVLEGVNHSLYRVSPEWGRLTDSNGEAVFEVRSARAGTFVVQVRDEVYRLLGSGGVVTFTPGPIDSNRTRIQLTPSADVVLPADGVTPYSVTVTVGDRFGNPISGAGVSIEVWGDSGITVIQPSAPTDAAGQAVGRVFGTSRRVFALRPRVNGELHSVSVRARFGGPDLSIAQRILQPVYVGQSLDLEILIANRGVLTAQQVTATLVLDERLRFAEQTAPAGVSFTREGGELRWQIAELAPGGYVVVRVTAIADPAQVGDTLQLSTVVAGLNGDDDPENNSAAATAVVMPWASYEARMDEPVRLIGNGVGNRITYTLWLSNTGIVSDAYQVFLRLPQHAAFRTSNHAVPVSEEERIFRISQVALKAGQSVAVPVEVGTDGCEPPGKYDFRVLVSAESEPITRVLTFTLVLASRPDFLRIQPVTGFRTARSVVFSWLTHSADASGSVNLRLRENPSAGQVYPTERAVAEDGLFKHTVVVSDLVEGDYVWEASLSSRCGTASTQPTDLHVSRGVGFAAAKYSAVIERDYNQEIVLNLINFDDHVRQVSATVATPDGNADLAFGFVGDGSTDRLVELGPGETKAVRLFVHAQDARLSRYDLIARVSSVQLTNQGAFGIASAGESAVVDQALVEVTVRPPSISYTLQDITEGYAGGARRYRLTNHGDPLTDITVEAETITGSGYLFLYPKIEHAYLRTGDSLEFDVVPVIGDNFVSMEAKVIVRGGNGRLKVERLVRVSLDEGGPAGASLARPALPTNSRQVYVGRVSNVLVEGWSSGWYCTNLPNISYDVPLPAKLLNAVRPFNSRSSAPRPLSARLHMRFDSGPGVEPHNTQVFLNDASVLGLAGTVPNGWYRFELNPFVLRPPTLDGKWEQVVRINTVHMNRGHYVVNTGANIRACYRVYEERVIASSQEEANAIVARRSYVRPLPEGGGQLTIIHPQNGQVLSLGQPVTVVVRVAGSSSSSPNEVYLYTPTGRRIPMQRSRDQEYVAQWQPDEIGTHRLTVSANECGQGDAEVTVQVSRASSDPDEGLPPRRGSFFRAYPRVALPDGHSRIVVTLTVRDPENDLDLRSRLVRIYNTGPQPGNVVSATGLTNMWGQFSVVLTSTKPGMVTLTAHDLANDEPISASITVNFAVPGKVEVKPRDPLANGVDRAFITVTLDQSVLTSELVRRSVIGLSSSRVESDYLSLTRTLPTPAGVVTATLTSTVEGRTIITAFALLPSDSASTSPSTLVPVVIDAPVLVRFRDARSRVKLEVNPPVTYVSSIAPSKAVVTFTLLEDSLDTRIVTVTVTTTRPLADHLSKVTGVTNEQGVFTVTISSRAPGASNLLLTFFDPKKIATVTLSTTVKFLQPIGSISVTISPKPPILFPQDSLIISGTLVDPTGNPLADRHVIFEFKSKTSGNSLLISRTTDVRGQFSGEIEPIEQDGSYKVRAYEFLGTGDYWRDPSKWFALGEIAQVDPVFVVDRPTKLVVRPQLGEAGTPFTVTLRMLVGRRPYTDHPSVNTPVKLEMRPVTDSGVITQVGVITTSDDGKAMLTFTPTHDMAGAFVMRATNLRTDRVAAEQEFYVKPAGSTCQGLPQIISYTTNYKLGESTIYPARIFANGMLSVQLSVNWRNCQPGKIIVTAPGITKEYSFTGQITSTREATYTFEGILDVFGLPEGRNVIQISMVSADGVPSRKLELVQRAVDDLSSLVDAILEQFGVPELVRLIVRTQSVANPASHLPARPVTSVRHPVHGSSVRGIYLTKIYPHPADQEVSGLFYKIQGLFTGRTPTRPAKVKLGRAAKLKSVNLLNIGVPFVCDAGPYANVLMMKFFENKVLTTDLKKDALLGLARQVAKNVQMMDRYLDRIAEPDSDTYEAMNKKRQFVVKVLAGFGLPPLVCDAFYQAGPSSMSSLNDFITRLILGPFKIGFDAQLTWTWMLVPMLLRLVPTIGMAASVALEFICTFLRTAACGPEIYITFGVGLSVGTFLYRLARPSELSRNFWDAWERLAPVGISLGTKALLGAEWGIDKNLYLNAEVGVSLKFGTLYGGMNTRVGDAMFPTFCLESVKVEGEAFIKAVVKDLWATDEVAAGPLLEAKFPDLARPCLESGGQVAPFDPDIDDQDVDISVDADSIDMNDEDADSLLPVAVPDGRDPQRSVEPVLTGTGVADMMSVVANAALDRVTALLLEDGLLPLTPTQVLTKPVEFKLIRPIGRGDPTYAVFAERPGRLTAFSQPAMTAAASAAGAATTISSVLVSNVFTYTSVAIAHEPNGDRSILVWSHDNPNSPVGGSRELVYSIWDGSSWSQPRVLTPTQDSVVDLTPSVVWDTTGRVVLAWVRATRSLTDTPNLNPFEIATALYNPSTGEWTRVNLVTQNDHPDITPQLVHDGQGRVMLVWREIHPRRGSVLLSRVLNRDGSWGAAEVAFDKPTLSFDVAYHNGQATLVGAAPVASSVGVTYQVFVAQRMNGVWQPAMRISSDANANHRSVAVAYDADGKAIVGWVANERIMLRKLDGVGAEELNSDALGALAQGVSGFRLLRSPQGNLAVLMRDALKPASLRVLPLDTQSRQLGLIGAPLLLSSPPTESVLSLDAAFDRRGRLLAGYVRVVNDIVTKTRTVTRTIIDGTPGMSVFSEPRVVTREEVAEKLVPRRADLLTLAHVPGRDTAVFASLEYSVEVSSGVLISVTARARNTGDYLENVPGSAKLEFYEGDPNAGGRLVESVQISRPIPPGGWVEHGYAFLVSPTEQLTLAVRLVVDDDPRPANNTALIPLTFSAMPRVRSLESVDMTETNAGARVGIFGFGLSSDGFVTSTESVMTVTLSQDQRTVAVRSVAVPRIAPKTTAVVTVTMPLGALRSGSYTVTAELKGVERRFMTVQKVPADLVLEHAEWTDLSFAPVLLDVRVRNDSWFTVTDAVLLVADGSSNSLIDRGGIAEPVGDLGPGESVTVTLILTRPQLCSLNVSVFSPSVSESNLDNNGVSEVNNRLCFGVSLDAEVEPVQTQTNTLFTSLNVSTSLPAVKEGVAPLRVRLTATTELTDAQWLWHFGDGITDTRQHTATHIYTRAGTYWIKVEVTDPERGATAYAIRHVRVHSPTRPIIGCSGCDSARVGQTLVLTNASEGKVEAVSWNLGDGSITVTGGLVEHAYAAPGVYTVTLSVKGLEGDWRTATRTITVTDAPTYRAYLPRVIRSVPEALPRHLAYLPVVRRR